MLMGVTMFAPLLSFVLFLLPFLSLLFLNHHTKNPKKAKLPPGPPKLPIIGNLHQIGENPHHSLWKLSQKYGPTMLLHLGHTPMLVVSSAETAKEILKTHDLDCCTRPLLFSHRKVSYNYSDVAGAPYGSHWRQMRKICVLNLFNTKRVQSFGFIREEEVASMVNSISQASSSVINLTEMLFSLTSIITSKVAFGKSYHGREFNGIQYQDLVREAIAIIGCFSAYDHFASVGWILDTIRGLHARIEKVFHAMDKFNELVIEEHLNPMRSQQGHEDIVDVLLGLERDHEESNDVSIKREHIKAIFVNIFIGGVESTSVTIEWAMAELIRNPRVMKKAQDEIRITIGTKGKVEESDLDQLQYLKRVVKETLRLHPPAPFLLPRETMRCCRINGYNIDPKTMVQVNVWAIGRDPKYWVNPDEFWPERFEDSSVDFQGQYFELLPFGAGRRGCPAIFMGATTVELGLANLLYGFDWGLPYGMKKEDLNMDELVAGVALHKKIPLHLVPTIHI